MTLHEYPHLEQGSEQWHDLRRGLVTASTIGNLLTATGRPANNDTSRRFTLGLVAERITGYTEPTFVNDDILRGQMDEPVARDLYAQHILMGEVTEIGFMVRDFEGFSLGFSPDGLVGQEGFIEIKSRRQKKHLQTILEDRVPAENVAQIQAGLLVSGRDWCDYVSYCAGMPLYVKQVLPDSDWHDSIVAADSAGRPRDCGLTWTSRIRSPRPVTSSTLSSWRTAPASSRSRASAKEASSSPSKFTSSSSRGPGVPARE
jgi:hypothetical protein